jgi:hypothetical protein
MLLSFAYEIFSPGLYHAQGVAMKLALVAKHLGKFAGWPCGFHHGELSTLHSAKNDMALSIVLGVTRIL